MVEIFLNVSDNNALKLDIKFTKQNYHFNGKLNVSIKQLVLEIGYPN